MPNIRFDMCVNDDEGYGQHTRHLRAAQFEIVGSGLELHLDCTGREMICERLEHRLIRVGRCKFHILHYSSYVGNMMWDSAIVTPETANAIANLLRQSGKYDPTDGAVELRERWESGAALFQAVQP